MHVSKREREKNSLYLIKFSFCCWLSAKSSLYKHSLTPGVTLAAISAHVRCMADWSIVSTAAAEEFPKAPAEFVVQHFSKQKQDLKKLPDQ